MEQALSHPELAWLALSCLDLTSLRADDTDAEVEALAAQAKTPHGVPAALCVYPRFVPVAKRALARHKLAVKRQDVSNGDEVVRKVLQ